MVELGEFAEREEELKAAGIDILALSVDQWEGPDSTAAAAEAAVKQLALNYSVGRATPVLVGDLYALRNAMMSMAQIQPLIPSSFLVDRDGRLVVMYTGPVAVDDLMADALMADAASSDGIEQRFLRAAPLPGRIVRHAVVSAAMNEADALSHYLAGLQFGSFSQSRPYQQAILEYQEALKLKPGSAEIHLKTAAVLARQGRYAEATDHGTEALRHQPAMVDAHILLGDMALREKRFGEAEAYYQDAIKITPNNADLHLDLGVVCMRQRDVTRAIEHFKESRALAQAQGRKALVRRSESLLSDIGAPLPSEGP